MSLREIIQYVLLFLFYTILQIFILRNVVLFDYGFCFIYVAALLSLPSDTSKTWLLFLGFFTGLLMDVFYNTLGMHAAASVLIMYLRPFWIQIQLETKGVDRVEISLNELGLGKYLTFLVPLIFIHHSMLFLVEMSNVGMVGVTMIRIVGSTLFTTFMIVLLQFFSRR